MQFHNFCAVIIIQQIDSYITMVVKRFQADTGREHDALGMMKGSATRYALHGLVNIQPR